MKTTGIFTTGKFIVPFKKYGQPISLIPFGDVHRSSPLCSLDKWRKFCAESAARIKAKENIIFIGMGDYDDLASTSERVILEDTKLHEATKLMIEDTYLANTMRFAKEIAFMRGRLIGLIEGNHYGVFPSGITTTQKLAELMGTGYLGVMTHFRLILQPPTKDHGQAVDIYAHHGVGAARLMGGSLNRVSQAADDYQAHIYLMGHDHKLNTGKRNRMELVAGRDGEVFQKEVVSVIARTGSFLRGMVSGQPSYVADGAGTPNALGVTEITIIPRAATTKERAHFELKSTI